MPLALTIALSAIVACIMVAALVLVGYLVGRLMEACTDVKQLVDWRHKVTALAPVILCVVGIVAVAAFDLILAFGQVSLWATVSI